MPGAPAWIRPLAAMTRLAGRRPAGRAAVAHRTARVRAALHPAAAERGLIQIDALDASMS